MREDQRVVEQRARALLHLAESAMKPASASIDFAVEPGHFGLVAELRVHGSSWVRVWWVYAAPARRSLDRACVNGMLNTRVWLQASAITSRSAIASWFARTVSSSRPKARPSGFTGRSRPS